MNNHNRHVQPPARPDKQTPLLRAHKRALFLLAFYIPLVLLPWIITLILTHRPLTKSSWTYAPGFSYKDYKLMQGWAKAIPVLNAVAAILAIPIASSIVAQAAVVFAQRRYPGQQLSVRHLFSLADRAWCDWRTLYNMLWWTEAGSASVIWFLLAGAALVILGAVQYPLFQLLAPWKEITIPNCRDTQYIRGLDYGVETCDFDYREWQGYSQIGVDLEPAQMAVISASHILPRIRNDLSAVSYRKSQPYLWQEIDKYGYHSPANIDYATGSDFVAALPADTTTGVLREHIMRLNSSVSCNNLAISEYPSTCSGTHPLQASFDYDESNYDGRNTTIDICAPGDLGKHPWTLSRNRQELSEELFLKFTGTRENGLYDGVLHCTAQTTRGYFELGNAQNGEAYGPLLDKWPSAGPSLKDYQFNDYFGFGYRIRNQTQAYIPSEEDHSLGEATPTPDPRTNWDAPATFTNMSGPLMMSVLALFGTDSWIHSVSNLTLGKNEDALEASNSDQPALVQPLCTLTPFARARLSANANYNIASCMRDGLSGLQSALDESLAGWSYKDTAEYRLRFAIFLSNQAALTSHSEGVLPWAQDTGRKIYTAPGMTVSKPSIALPAQIILSIIVAAQVLGLLWLGCWIYTRPTWTRTLDAMAVARIAASLEPGLLPPFEVTGRTEQEKLARVDGLVGVRGSEEAGERRRSDDSGAREHVAHAEIEMEALSVASTAGKEPSSSTVQVSPGNHTRMTLGLGAPGLVAKRGDRAALAARQGAQSV